MAEEEMLVLCTLMYLAIIVAICAYNVDRDEHKGRRKMWVKPWILCRKVKGAYHTLFNELLNMDQESFKNYMRPYFVQNVNIKLVFLYGRHNSTCRLVAECRRSWKDSI